MNKWRKIHDYSKRIGVRLTDSLMGKNMNFSIQSDGLEERIAERLENSDYLCKKLEEQKMFNAEVAYQCLQRRRIKRIIRNYGGVAAMIALVVGGWLLFRQNDSLRGNVIANKEIIVPGGHKAMLTLPGGDVVLLKDSIYTPIHTAAGLLQIDSARVLCNTDSVVSKDNEVVYSKIYIPRGGEYQLVLADGSQVWLNSDTELKFPLHFNGGAREVFLKGEAYFDIKTDKDRPFVVHTVLGNVKVLGTAFNVSAYYSDRIAATLERGSISYVCQNGNELIVKPGEQLTYKVGDMQPEVIKVNTRLYTVWKEHLFSFEEQRLDEIMETLARWYDFQVFFESEDLKELEFSGTLDKYSEIAPLLELFELGGRIKFSVNGKTIIVRR